jgi:hypothetical protein
LPLAQAALRNLAWSKKPARGMEGERGERKEKGERVRGTAFGMEEWVSECRRKRPGEKGREGRDKEERVSLGER